MAAMLSVSQLHSLVSLLRVYGSLLFSTLTYVLRDQASLMLKCAIHYYLITFYLNRI